MSIRRSGCSSREDTLRGPLTRPDAPLQSSDTSNELLDRRGRVLSGGHRLDLGRDRTAPPRRTTAHRARASGRAAQLRRQLVRPHHDRGAGSRAARSVVELVAPCGTRTSGKPYASAPRTLPEPGMRDDRRAPRQHLLLRHEPLDPDARRPAPSDSGSTFRPVVTSADTEPSRPSSSWRSSSGC